MSADVEALGQSVQIVVTRLADFPPRGRRLLFLVDRAGVATWEYSIDLPRNWWSSPFLRVWAFTIWRMWQTGKYAGLISDRTM